MLDIQTYQCGESQIAYHVFGDGKINIVVEMGLGAAMGEWWHIAQALSAQARYTVLLYERVKSGNRKTSVPSRSPEHIAKELKALLDALGHEERIILLAHSQGGLYAQQFARLYPSLVKGLILLDPLTAEDNRFRAVLTPEEFRKSGVDKFSNLTLPKTLAKLHLGFVIKAFMKSAPPLCYAQAFSNDARAYVLDALTKPAFYQTAMEEYRLSHLEENLSGLHDAAGFPRVPLALITHSSALAEKETMEFGGASPEPAKKVEELWQTLMKNYLTFSPSAKYIQAEKSTHYIHLMQPELIDEALEFIEKTCA
ncbi:MAG: alpha/beta hydrolase [Eubacteriales bacterium]|nr:alpha/beta hydrolase [Eubacteriales bacterium]